MRASITTYKPSSGPTPSIPLALSSGTVWYGDSNYTTVVPFDTSTHAFERPIPDPTAMPNAGVLSNASPTVLKGAPLAPGSLARGPDGNLWGVGHAEKRLGFTGYASTSGIVEYDPAGSSRAFLIPPLYTPGDLTVEGPNGRPWSMVWKDGTRAWVVQLNADGSITPKFSVALSKLPVQHSSVDYARYGKNGIVWLFHEGYPHPRITQWILGTQSPTEISLPASGNFRSESLTTAGDGSAWVIGQEIHGTERSPIYFYRVSPSGLVSTLVVHASNLEKGSPKTAFFADGSVWCVATNNFGPNVGDAFLLRVGASGVVTQVPLSNAKGAIAAVGPSIAGPGDVAFLSSFSGEVPVLHVAP